MKNIVFLLITLFVITSCESEDPVIYDSQNGITGIKFESTKETITLTSVQPSISTDVPVTVSTLSNQERRFNVVVDNDYEGGLVQLPESNYTIGEVIIPANEFFGEFNVTINNTDLDPSLGYELKLNLDTPEGVSILEQGKDSVLFIVTTN